MQHNLAGFVLRISHLGHIDLFRDLRLIEFMFHTNFSESVTAFICRSRVANKTPRFSKQKIYTYIIILGKRDYSMHGNFILTSFIFTVSSISYSKVFGNFFLKFIPILTNVFDMRIHIYLLS